MIANSDKEYFAKLKCENVLELALNKPIYEDRRESNSPNIGNYNAFKATIKGVFLRKKMLSVSLYIDSYNKSAQAVIFNPKQYHRATFIANTTAYFYAKIIQKGGVLQVVQPKIITSFGNIEPIYKTAVSLFTMKRLIKTYITRDNLMFLPEHIVDNLMQMHFPKDQLLEDDVALYTLKFCEAYNHLNKYKNKRRYTKAVKQLNNDDLVLKWRKNLPFKLTAEQEEVSKTVISDLLGEYATKRVVIGDVGSGKTVIIMLCATIAYRDKSVLMAPTTILAHQLYVESKKLLTDDLRVVLVNEDSKANLDDYDLIIGTHKLLYMNLPQVALIMVDEQHRFGVKQRELLKNLTKDEISNPHFLQFSATPIPRTQSLIDSCLIDVSLIKQTPFKKDIETKIVGDSDFPGCLAHFKSEIEAQRQVIVVYPLVNESETMQYKSLEESKPFWQREFSGVLFTHGKDKDKEQVLQDFSSSGTILITTTLIEVGLSLPKLSTIFIVGAERLGLATLHQLRGRVSRNGLKGYCYLYTKSKEHKRLELFSKTLDGFSVAELDLKLRESGDILSGTKQSGNQFKYISLFNDLKVWQVAKDCLK